MPLTLTLTPERWRLRQPFTISRGSRTHAEVIRVELTDGRHRGRGEASPNARYGETVESTLAVLSGLDAALAADLDRAGLQAALPHGTARNALDCAFWDLEAKRSGRRAWDLAGLAPPPDVTTVFTISLGPPATMAADAAAAAGRPVLKLKLGGAGDDLERVAAVRQAAPAARLIADANEGWTLEQCRAGLPRLKALGVELLEQPLPQAEDAGLAEFEHAIPICADESVHDRADLDRLAGRYEFVNIKLDKTGGLTEALALAEAARARGFGLMVGCMLGTSLGMAPAQLVGGLCRFVDIDAPLLLAEDRTPPLAIAGSRVSPPAPELWG